MKKILIIISIIILYSCNKMNVNPPIAKKVEKKLEIHDDVRIDNYYWLNQRENPDVVSYLDEENKYKESRLKSTKTLQKNLYKEMKSRIKEDDNSVPYFLNDYWYITKYEKNKEYPIYTRKFMNLESEKSTCLQLQRCNEQTCSGS